MAYPPKPTKRNSSCFDISVVTVYIIVLCYLYCFGSHNDIRSASVIRCNILILITKATLFINELIFYRKLYKNPEGLTKLLLWVVKMDNWLSFVIISIANSVFFFSNNNIKELLNISYQDDLLIFFSIIGLYLRWGDCPLTESYRLEQSSKFSGGASMAKSFYYGYLKMILEENNLIKSINDFFNSENLKPEQMPVMKLFILIPLSAKIPNEIPITNPKEENIEHVPNATLTVNRNRCMVMKRSYKCSMYILKYEGKKYYLPFEGATPLKTFYETCERDPSLKEFSREIVTSFYHTLSALVNEDTEMKRYVELVYYNDAKNPDLDQVLIQRLRYLKRQRKLKQT